MRRLITSQLHQVRSTNTTFHPLTIHGLRIPTSFSHRLMMATCSQRRSYAQIVPKETSVVAGSIADRIPSFNHSTVNDLLKLVQDEVKVGKFAEALMNIHRAMFTCTSGTQMSQIYHYSSQLLLAFSGPQKKKCFYYANYANEEMSYMSVAYVAMISHCRVLIGSNMSNEMVQQVLDSLLQQAVGMPGSQNVIALILLMKGMSYHDTGSTDQSIQALDKAIETVPDFSIPYVIKGLVLASEGDTDNALICLNKAVEIDPNNPLTLVQRATVLIHVDSDAAFHDIARAIEIEPDNPTTYLIRGNIFSEHAETVDMAIEDFTKCISLNSIVPAGYYARARLLSRYPEHYSDAKDDLAQILEIDHQFTPAYNLRAVIEHDQKNYRAALDSIAKVIEFDESYPLIYEFKGKVLLEGTNDLEGAEESFKKAMENRSFTLESLHGLAKINETKNPQLAKSYLTEAIDLEPHYHETYILRAYLNLRMQMYQEALSDFDQAISIAEEGQQQLDVQVLVDRASASVMVDDPARSVAELKNILDNTNDVAVKHKVWTAMSQAYSQAGMTEECMNALDESIALDPSNAFAHYSKGLAFRAKLNDEQSAIREFSEAIELSDDPRYYYERGISYKNIDSFENAKNDLDQALARNQNYAEAYGARASVLFEIERYKEALSDIEKAISLNPNNAAFFCEKARVLLSMDESDPVEARDDINNALELDPNNAVAYFIRARIYLDALDDIRKGLKDLNTAISLDEHFFDAYLYRANYHRVITKNYKSALEDIDICMKLRPESDEVLAERDLILQKQHDQ